MDISLTLASAAAGIHRLLMVPTLSLAEAVDKVAQRLTDEFSPTVPGPRVRQVVDEVFEEMSSARVTQFVPVLVDRSVRARLRAQAH